MRDAELTLALPPAVVEVIARRAAAIVNETLSAKPESFIGVAEAAEHLACKPQRIYDLVSHVGSNSIATGGGCSSAAPI